METFHEHDQETTVATGVNIKNLTYYVQPGRPKAKGSASDLFPGAGANFGKRISEAHGRKWLESHTQPSAPVYAENFEAFYLYCVQQIHRADVNTLLVKKRTARQLAYVTPAVAPTIIWVSNLLDMALAGFNINSPAAIHADLQYKNSIKVPTTTATLNTLVAGWNNNCAPLYQSRGAAEAKIPFADYKIQPLTDIAIIAEESVHPLSTADGEILANGPTGYDIMKEVLRLARFTATADQLEMAIARHLLNCDNNEILVNYTENSPNNTTARYSGVKMSINNEVCSIPLPPIVTNLWWMRSIPCDGATNSLIVRAFE